MMKKITLFALCLAMMAAVSCGGNSNKGGEASGNENKEQPAEVAAGQPESKAETAPARQEPKVKAKKWYEQDFSLTEKMYVSTASMTRTYARKGNIVISNVEGSGMTNLFVCTDSTRTQYLVNDAGRTYVKRGVKTDFDSVDDAIYQYLKGQMSNTIFADALKKGDKETTARDTILFGRPAYVLTQETTKTGPSFEVWGKTIMYVDKENGLPYYKWGIMKTNGKVDTEGKAFEVTAFSAEPTYEGLIVSLDGLTEVTK